MIVFHFLIQISYLILILYHYQKIVMVIIISLNSYLFQIPFCHFVRFVYRYHYQLKVAIIFIYQKFN